MAKDDKTNGSKVVEPQPSPESPTPPKVVSVEDVPTEGYVTMLFPRAVKLMTDDRKIIHFPKGPNQVPKEFQDHWYLKACKVTLYSPRGEKDAS